MFYSNVDIECLNTDVNEICLCFSDSPKRFWPLHWASWIASATGIVLVLVARGHYTVDVVIAYYVTTRVFWIYHTLANHANLKVYLSLEC